MLILLSTEVVGLDGKMVHRFSGVAAEFEAAPASV